MNVWIIEANRGITILSYSAYNLPLNETLVSGLITALNQLTLVEFKSPIESIDMGGFKWIYILDSELNLLFVIADNIDISTETLKGRLGIIKDKFMEGYVRDRKKWKEEWNGDVDKFKNFKKVIETYYNQWSQASNVDNLAEFFDLIGIIQQVLNLLKTIVDNHLDGMNAEEVYSKIEKVFNLCKSESNIKAEPQLANITFSRGTGFNIFNINPINSDINFIRQIFLSLISEITDILRERLGGDQCVNLFHREGIIKYLIKNFKLVKNLDLDIFLLTMLFKD